MDITLDQWEFTFRQVLSKIPETMNDPAHDLAHFKRVVTTAKTLALKEGAKMEVVVPAAWLHDLVNLPKNHPDRKTASKLSAKEAIRILTELHYPSSWFNQIEHAIEAHSFSAAIQPKTLEAKVVQDADRLEALGAIGISRCFIVGGALCRPIYDLDDPFCEKREPNDSQFSLDHFFVKLLKLADSFQTEAARKEALRRTEYMKGFLAELRIEIL